MQIYGNNLTAKATAIIVLLTFLACCFLIPGIMLNFAIFMIKLILGMIILFFISSYFLNKLGG